MLSLLLNRTGRIGLSVTMRETMARFTPNHPPEFDFAGSHRDGATAAVR